MIVVKQLKNLLCSKNIKHLVKFKSPKISAEYKKNSVKFKISKKYSFLRSITKLVYI